MIFPPEVVGTDSRNVAMRKALAELLWNWRERRRELRKSPRLTTAPFNCPETAGRDCTGS